MRRLKGGEDIPGPDDAIGRVSSGLIHLHQGNVITQFERQQL